MEDEANVVFVIRIGGINDIHSKHRLHKRRQRSNQLGRTHVLSMLQRPPSKRRRGLLKRLR